MNFPGVRSPLLGGYMWPVTPIYELGWSIPVKNHVWKFGVDWLSLLRVIIWIFWGQKPPIRGVTCDLRCPFSNLAELFQSSHAWKFGSDWLNLSRVIVSSNIFSGGQKPPIRRVTFDLWCLFSNSDELFPSKVMCENLAWIGWNRRYVNVEGAEGGLHVTCDAHFRTWLSFSR